jgi:hypothetical protein
VALFGISVENDVQRAMEGKKGKAAEAAASGAIAKWVNDGTASAPRYRTPMATA